MTQSQPQANVRQPQPQPVRQSQTRVPPLPSYQRQQSETGIDGAITGLGDALRHFARGLDSNRSGYSSRSRSSDRAGYSFRSMDSGVDHIRGVVEGVVDGFFQGYDEIEVLELFFDVDYDTIDHAAFKQGVIDALRAMGMDEEQLALLKITLRRGSVVVNVSGPLHIIQAVTQLPLKEMEVCGYYAKLSREDLRQEPSVPTATPFHCRPLAPSTAPAVHASSSGASQQANSLDQMTESLTTRSDGTFTRLLPAEFREEAARELLQGIVTALQVETPPTARSAELENAITAQVIAAPASAGLMSITDQDIRSLVQEALDVWFGTQLEESSTAPAHPLVTPLVRIPRPSSADIDQFTERLFTGRDAYSTASSEVCEDVTMGFLMEMQTPLIEAAVAAPPLPRPDTEILQQMTTRVVERHAPGHSSTADTSRDVIVRDLFDELASVLFGPPSPVVDPRMHPFRQRGRPNSRQAESMAQRIMTSRSWSSQSREGQQEAVRGMINQLTDMLFGGSTSQSPAVTSRSTATYDMLTHRSTARQPRSGHGTARSARSAHSLARPSSREIQRMAQSVAQRYGAAAAEPQMVGMLEAMSDNLFGPPSVRGATSAASVAPGVNRPSPRSLEEITQRVVTRTEGGVQNEVVQEVLMELTDSLFGGAAGSQAGSALNDGSLRRPSPRSLENAASRLSTARTSRTSRSTTSDEIRANLDDEVRGLLDGLCGALFGPTPR